MVKRYPHSAIISYKAESSYNNGIFTPGEETTIDIECNIQPAGSNKYIAKIGGDVIPYSYRIFCSLFENEIPEGAVIRFFSKEFTILQLFKYQKHIEIKC